MNIFARFREHAGWSQADLAEAMGTTKAAISNWETGVRTIKPSMAHRFLQVASEHGFEASLEDVYPTPTGATAA